MLAFFEKLERAAERLVGNLDGHIQEPLVRAMTGEVFTHNTVLSQPDAVACSETSSEDIPNQPQTGTPVGIEVKQPRPVNNPPRILEPVREG